MGRLILPSILGPPAPVAAGQWFIFPLRASQPSKAKQAASFASGCIPRRAMV
jgi:hypothetical protein